MNHETTWYASTIGAAAAAGSGPLETGSGPDCDRAAVGDHTAERLSVVATAPAARRRWAPGAQGLGATAQAEASTAPVVDGAAAEGRDGGRLRKRLVDLSPDRATRAPEIRRTVPRRCHSALDGWAWFFPLRSPNVAHWNVMRPPSHDGSSTIGRVSNASRPGFTRTLFLWMKQASCSSRWCNEPGPLAVRRRRFVTASGTTSESRVSVACRCRPSGVAWAGTCSSTAIRAFDKRRSYDSCNICCGICVGEWSSCGITCQLTEAGCCNNGLGDAVDSTWSISQATRPSLTPSSMAGRTSKGPAWPTTALRMASRCTAASPRRPMMSHANNHCFAVLSRRLSCPLN